MQFKVQEIDINTSLKLKAIGALVVMNNHVLGAINSTTSFSDTLTSIGMFMFLFMSGYGVYLSYLSGGGS